MKTRRIDLPHGTIHVATVGSGSPLVLLHGGGIDSAQLSWSEAIEPLALHFQLYLPDWPGYGESGPFGDDRYPVERLVDVLQRLLDELELEQVRLMGVSMGGAAALGYALNHPQRVRKLVLVDSYGLQSQVSYHKLAYLFVQVPVLRKWIYSAMRRSRRFTRWGLQTSIFASPVPERVVDEVYQILQQPSIEDTFAFFQRSEIGWDGLHTCYMERLHELTMPVLLIHGAEDKLVPLAAAQAAATRIQNARLHIFEKTGHWVPRECPQEFNQVALEFLKS